MISSRVVGGRYVVLGELGRGRLGVVWRAEDRVSGRQVAVKELRLRPCLPASEHARFRERLLREARAAGRLDLPGLVAVRDVVCHEGVDHIVTELVEATALAGVVARDGPLGRRAALDLARQLLAVLRCAHAGGIVHGDVTPGNVLLGLDGRVVLTDVGIARAAEASGLGVGSPAYTAPERLAGSATAPAGDLWALGATLFHAVAGVAPEAHGGPAGHRGRGPLAGVIAGLLVCSPQARLTGDQAAVLLDARAPRLRLSRRHGLGRA